MALPGSIPITTRCQNWYSLNHQALHYQLQEDKATHGGGVLLAAMEGNLEKFIDTAGFQLVRILGDKKRIAYEHIESWRRGENPNYKPTWSGLLSLLERIELDSLAQSIDSIL